MEYKSYKVEPYFNSNKEPFGVTLKSKSKDFIGAHQNVKKMLIKDKVYKIKDDEIKVVEVTNKKGHFVAIIEVNGNNKEIGNVEIKVHEPGKRGATLELRKMSGYDYLHVEVLESMLIVFVDGFIAGDDVQEIIQGSNLNKPRKSKIPTKYSCHLCNFQSRFTQGLKAHITKIHAKESPIKCDKCEMPVKNKALLVEHNSNCHMQNKKRANLSVSPTSSPPKKKHEGHNKQNDKIEHEAQEHDVEMLDVEYEAKDVWYRMLQERIDELEALNAAMEVKLKVMQDKNTENEMKIKQFQEIDNYEEKKKKVNEVKIPDHLHPVKEEHLSKLRGYKMIFKSQPNGACLDNCAAVHIYEDVDEAPKLKKRVNYHVADNWDNYYKYKIPLPFTQTVGVGEHAKNVTIKTREEMLQFLKSDDALMVFSDSQQILAMANLFNIKIHTFTYGGGTEGWTLVTPDPEMAKQAEIKFGKFVPDMALYHSNDTHFDLLVSDDSRLALLGFLLGTENDVIEEKELKDESKPNEEWITVRNKRSLSHKSHSYKEIKENQEENQLFNNKNNGFKRTGPQSQSEKKSEQNSNFMCDQCGCELHSLGLLTAHIASHTELLQFECDFCDNVFENSHTLQYHMKEKHADKKDICEIRGKNFENKEQPKKHIENKHLQNHDNQGNEWNCDGCPFQAERINDLINHLKITGHQPCKNIELKKYFNEYKKCYTCKMEFDGYYKLMNHRKGVHPSTKRCRNFPETCTWGKDCWYVHPDEPMDVEPSAVEEAPSSIFNCNHCGEIIQGRGDFMKHKRIKHSDTVLPCENFLKGMCKRNEDTCWFKHSSNEISQQGQNKFQNQVFPQASQNPAPPDQTQLYQFMNSILMRMEQMELKLNSLAK